MIRKMHHKLFFYPSKRFGGFTLIEVLISITILSIVLLALVPLLVTVMGVDRSASLEIKARQLATQRIEEMKAWSVDDINKCLGGSTSCNGDEGVVEKDWGVSFSRQWRIDQMPTTGTNNPAPLIFTATVQYSYRGQTKTKVFTSLWGY